MCGLSGSLPGEKESQGVLCDSWGGYQQLLLCDGVEIGSLLDAPVRGSSPRDIEV